MIILVGASATGKTEVGKILKSKYNINKVITYTTRQKREKETNNIDYHFISKDEFLNLSKKNFFFETIEYNGSYYGTSFESIKDDAYVILDPIGLLKYKKSNIKSYAFYLDTPEDVRYQRMIGRGDGKEKALSRLETDRNIFKDEYKKYADYIIDVTYLSVEEVADEIYNKYKDKING